MSESVHTCTRCPICHGDGNYYVDGWGRTSPYMFEDTDDSETCDYCEGSGHVGLCRRCDELELEEQSA